MRIIDFGVVLLQKTTSPTKEKSSFPVANDTKTTEGISPFKQLFDQQIDNQNTSKLTSEQVSSSEDHSIDLEVTDFEELVVTEEVESSVTTDILQSFVNIEETSLELTEITSDIVEGEISPDSVTEGNQADELVQVDEKLMNLINEIINELNLSLQLPIDANNVMKLTKSIEQLFHLWDDLPLEIRRLIKESQLPLQSVELEEATKLLNELLNSYEKRQSFAKQQVYALDATITQQDIKKWLTQSLERHSLFSENNQQVSVRSNQPLQMSATQQYTFHATNSERIDAISRNLVSDVQQVVQRSNFLKQPGLNELTFTLRPAMLGEVTIRLVQVDGTMTVKFLVATQAAKELFEANIHQLKPMFAPNQIVIERDMTVSDKQFYQEDQEALEKDEKQNESNEREEQTEQNEAQDVSFEELLHLLSKEANMNAEN